MIVRAMALADQTLFIAGPPDRVDQETAVRSQDNLEMRNRLARQNDAWFGRHGSLLWAITATDGSKLAECQIDAGTVFDSMAAAANGCLYFATNDGQVCCYAGK